MILQAPVLRDGDTSDGLFRRLPVKRLQPDYPLSVQLCPDLPGLKTKVLLKQLFFLQGNLSERLETDTLPYELIMKAKKSFAETYGRPYILKTDGCIHDGWLVISQPIPVFDQDYLYWLLSSYFAYNQFSGKVSSEVVKNLNSDKVANSIFPLPPIEEQQRIVQRLEKLMPLCEKTV